MNGRVIIIPALAGSLVASGWTCQGILIPNQFTTVYSPYAADVPEQPHTHADDEVPSVEANFFSMAATATVNDVVIVSSECGNTFEAYVARDVGVRGGYQTRACPDCGEPLALPHRLLRPLIRSK